MKTILYQMTEMSNAQTMGYIIYSDNGKIVVIDGGRICELPELLDFIGGKTVSAWFLTHAHRDHADAFMEVIQKNLAKIEKVYYNFPPENYIFANEKNNSDTIFKFNRIKHIFKNIEVIVTDGQVIKLDNLTFTVMSVPDTSINKNIINNTSVAFKMETGRESVMFLGDLGVENGDKMIKNHESEMRSKYVQMAHHGQNGVGRNVYEAIKPEFCLWPANRRIWDNDNGEGFDTWICKTILVREWMDEMGVKEHYISKDGVCRIEL